ncbi:M16 family metallopeptidase [Cloacibacterium normanense]|uniref:M16 family metallopeptidase n=1 Tax=Cloacibacterium normanense TaxID=237258 RepID=UPI00352E36EE
MRKQFLSFALSFFLIANAFAQNIPLDPSVRTGTLSNGMKYYIKKNVKPEKKVEFRLAINAGSINEDEDQRGLAHFMEHMNFNGTKNFPDNKLVDFLQSIGIKFGQHLNAYTSFDETVYMLPVPLDKPGNLDSGLKVMEDWAFNALLTDKEIEKERGVVLEELRLGLGADKRMLDQYLPKLAYNSRYADRLPIGKKEILQNFKPEALRRFHKDWYRPDLMALVVVGDINVDEMEQKIKANFSKYQNPANARKRVDYEVPNHKETLISIATDADATSSSAQFYIKDDGSAKPDVTVNDYQKSIVEQLAAAIVNNRLEELTNSEKPPFIFGYVSHSNFLRTKDAFQAYAMTKEGEQKNALKVLLEEVERAKRFGFSQNELDRAKSETLSNLEKSYNNRDKTESARLVMEYVRNFLNQEPIPGIEWEYELHKQYLPSVTLDQVNNILKNYIKDDSRVIVVTGPKKENAVLPTDAQLLATVDDVKNAQLKPYEDKAAIKTLVEPFKSNGKIVKTEADAKLGTTTFTLSNGAKVTYKKTDFKEDEIVFSAISLGGSSLISNEDIEKTQWAFPALSESGFNKYSKNDITKFLSGKQVSVMPYVGGISTGFNGNSTKKDFETLFQMIYGYFTNLNYDEASYNSYKAKQQGFLDNLLANPQTYFQSEVQKYLNQKNPRFFGILPDAKAWEKTSYKLAYDIYKKSVANAGNFHFYFVGNVDENQIKQLSEQYLASLPTTQKSETYKDLGYRPLFTSTEKVIKKGKDPKSMVMIRFSGETKYNEQEDLAMRALGEVATIKIIEKLREDEGGIYGGGARGSLNKVPYGSYNFSINFPCGPENAEKLTKIALAELQKMIDNGPEQKDLDKFKEGEANDDVTNMKDNNYWLQNITSYQTQGGDKYSVLNYLTKVKALTVKDLQAVGKKYLTDKNRMVFTLMPEVETPKTEAPKAAVSANVTAQQVIDNYAAALGGKSKLEAVKTVKTLSTIKVMGMEMEATTLEMAPNKSKAVQKVMGQEMVQVFDGEKGYMMQAGQRMDLPAPAIEEAKKKRLFEVLSYNAADFKTVEKVTEEGKELYLLAGAGKKLYFDTKTNLLVKSTSDKGDMVILDYMEVDGIKFPKNIKLAMMGQNMEMTNNQVIVNKEVSAEDFK